MKYIPLTHKCQGQTCDLPVASITEIIRAVPVDTVNSWGAWLKGGIWKHFTSNSCVGFPHAFLRLTVCESGKSEKGSETQL